MTKLYRHLLLRIGFVLINKHGFLVWRQDGKQCWNNPHRKKPYSLDDKSWKIYKGTR